MLQIALCDDNKSELTKLTKIICEYIERNQIIAEFFEFSHSDTLLRACEKQRFHLYILDILMPMVDGIELGREIRYVDKEAQIIYITAESSFALQSFAVNPLNFLVKPVEKQALYDTLTLALSKVDTEEATATVKTKEGLHTVALREIVCCEYIDRSVYYTLRGGNILHGLSNGQSFSSQIEPLLCDRDFLQPHVSFAVNLRYVEKLTREEIVLQGSVTVPVSKKQYTFVRDAYLDYRLRMKIG